MVDYANLTEAELLTIQAEEFRAAKLAEELEVTKTTFYTARKVAKDALTAEQATVMADLNALWDAKEANSYDVDFTPL